MVSVEALPAGEAGGEGGVVERRIINPWGWQDAYGFVQANEVSDTQRVLYCAGQVSVDAEGNPLHPGT
jgi:hypothetical protein